MKRIAVVLLLLALAGCGDRQALKPAAGRSLPQKPALASSTPTPDQLLQRTPEQRPTVLDELLTKSRQQPEDRFNLPPPG